MTEFDSFEGGFVEGFCRTELLEKENLRVVEADEGSGEGMCCVITVVGFGIGVGARELLFEVISRCSTSGSGVPFLDDPLLIDAAK
jgi:hypothetical protein